MANTFGAQMTKLRVSPFKNPDPGFVDGGVQVFNEAVTLNSQAIADTITVARLPKGAIPLYGVLLSSVSLGTAVISIGVAGDAAKYRAGAVFNTPNVPTMFGLAAANGEALAAEEDVIITIATAALPASGTLRVMFFYAIN
ncbi:hypothetical protein HBA54_27155 [Pelagibius litoralis]|uniref:Uncharacterized protein n=1 Tax=Pelagibius litoralis TaxID=374515 RepID=A0A967F3Q5_9PROT|nr:hypothetical protein [Pelagibius litoralis]NIA72276.1 hypothetical protein [Pelagibius litoralis]